jgi:FMN phosphatase YigB (HAD superfamily)
MARTMGNVQIRYCAFDILGTIFPWKESFRFLNLFGQLKLRPRLPEEELKRLLRNRIDSFFKDGKTALQGFFQDAYWLNGPKEAAFVVKMFQEMLLKEAEIHPKAHEVLKQLSRDYKLLLCSDTTGETRKMVKKSGIKGYFTREFYSDELHLTKSKEFYELVVKSFPGSVPAQYVSIGDSLRSDIAYPKSLGMKTIWVRNEALDPYDVKPDYMIEDLAQVVEIIEGIF